MAHAHHAHLFSHAWFDLHPKLVAGFKGGSISLAMGALLAISAVRMTELELAFPLSVALALDAVAAPPFVPGHAVGYFPDQFVRQARQAGIEELPPQF